MYVRGDSLNCWIGFRWLNGSWLRMSKNQLYYVTFWVNPLRKGISYFETTIKIKTLLTIHFMPISHNIILIACCYYKRLFAPSPPHVSAPNNAFKMNCCVVLFVCFQLTNFIVHVKTSMQKTKDTIYQVNDKSWWCYACPACRKVLRGKNVKYRATNVR